MSELLKAVQRHKQKVPEEDIAAMTFACPVCGNTAFPPSTIILQANYGSTHDGEFTAVSICGECFDTVAATVHMLADAMPKMA